MLVFAGRGSKMSGKNKHKKKRRGNGLFKKYISIVLIIVLVYTCVAGIAVFAYTKLSGPDTANIQDAMDNRENTLVSVDDETRHAQNDRKINIAMFGVDEDGFRTDVIFAASFDTETRQISLVAVPRDTKVKMPAAMIEDLEARGREFYIPDYTGTRGVCKINEVHAFAGDGYRNEYSVWILEELLDIDFDYFVNVNIEGFKSIVDAVGGVEVTIEKDLYYYDPAADFLIDLKAGTQVLNGEKAEMLVRFRKGYNQQDLDRIKVQQNFLKALMKKVLNTETLVSNIPALIKTFFKYVETDLTLTDALGYVKYLEGISVENLNTATIPGEGGSFFNPDTEAMRKMIEDVFYDVEAEEEPVVETPDIQEPEPKDSKDLVIEVLNGGDINGLAANKQEYLRGLGYKVEYIGNFEGDRIDETRIFVREEGVGADLKELFEDSVIIVDTNGNVLKEGSDVNIIIVLGLKQK